MTHLYGEGAALLTALCWSSNSIFFSLAGRRVGSASVNHIRLWVALLIMLPLHLILFGSLFPFSVSPDRLFWFALSGLVGFVLGDTFLFEALVVIGPRLSMLLMVLAPVFGTVLAWVFLGETLSPAKIGAILLTIAGIAWVISAGHNNHWAGKGKLLTGVLLGIGGAAGQAVGALLSKLGMAGGFSAISGNLIRVTTATLTLGLVHLARGRMKEEIGRMRDRRALAEIGAGALLGPVVGVCLSLYAISRTYLGVASTLMALSPVILLPASHFLFGEKITLRAVSGTLLALLGTALLFFLK
jgi:drug/metabolite transporter (DMT)-like permease